MILNSITDSIEQFNCVTIRIQKNTIIILFVRFHSHCVIVFNKMGLLRALMITAVVFFLTRIIVDRFLTYLPESIHPSILPNIPLILVFIVELLL